MVESIKKKSPEKQIQGKVSFENQTGGRNGGVNSNAWILGCPRNLVNG